MHFCPFCGNLLLVGTADVSGMVFSCPTCPYMFPIRKKITNKQALDRKQVDDVLGGPSAWENVDKTQTVCPQCQHHEAYFRQMQIRSADEPMSIFFRCVQCAHQWRQD
eukprot:TRINITY_DN11932_c0_g1_i1.p5 TRINITY_DN11932_c0_g1~~TRINITY_DN11932_c0_g1_i1.p5  ORF type:complete len:108 (-),score=16.91 TRINITY_DN11932_c0_g1_i1:201-524(-)